MDFKSFWHRQCCAVWQLSQVRNEAKTIFSSQPLYHFYGNNSVLALFQGNKPARNTCTFAQTWESFSKSESNYIRLRQSSFGKLHRHILLEQLNKIPGIPTFIHQITNPNTAAFTSRHGTLKHQQVSPYKGVWSSRNKGKLMITFWSLFTS